MMLKTGSLSVTFAVRYDKKLIWNYCRTHARYEQL